MLHMDIGHHPAHLGWTSLTGLISQHLCGAPVSEEGPAPSGLPGKDGCASTSAWQVLGRPSPPDLGWVELLGSKGPSGSGCSPGGLPGHSLLSVEVREQSAGPRGLQDLGGSLRSHSCCHPSLPLGSSCPPRLPDLWAHSFPCQGHWAEDQA